MFIGSRVPVYVHLSAWYWLVDHSSCWVSIDIDKDQYFILRGMSIMTRLPDKILNIQYTSFPVIAMPCCAAEPGGFQRSEYLGCWVL